MWRVGFQVSWRGWKVGKSPERGGGKISSVSALLASLAKRGAGQQKRDTGPHACNNLWYLHIKPKYAKLGMLI